MTNIIARTTLISLFLGLGVITQGQAEDYCIYQAPNCGLVISNKEPPPGSKIIKQHSWPDPTDSKVSQAQTQEPGKTPPTAQAEGSPKPSKDRQP